MGYQSVNEIENFSFEDCEIRKFEVNDTQISFELEALIVKPNNSQNSNYTESYVSTTELRLTNARIISAIKDGYRYYDANDVLVSEVADVILSDEQIKVLPSSCKGAYLFELTRQKEENGSFYYTLGIEFPGEDEYDNTNPESYTLEICFEKSIFSWEHYLNKVQR